MNFEKIKYNKKYNKNYFELNTLIKPTKEESQKVETKPNTNAPTNNNENTNPKQDIEENNNNNNQTNVPESSNEKKEETNSKPTASINDIVYPMYLPNNTYLTSQEKVNTKTGERLILTFSGESSFILVEETSKIEKENIVIPVNGEFDFLTDVIGIIGTKSLSWNSNGIDYYIASDVIETAELIDIARSISVLPVSK